MYEHELATALHAAKVASAVITKYSNQDYEVVNKSENQPVTIADFESNRIICEIISEAFPQDGWLSEETKDSRERLEKSRVWIVDPLDGTKEFIKNIPEYAVSIALVEDNQPVVGVIMNPATLEIFHAVRGEGAFCNGQAIHVLDDDGSTLLKTLASRSELSRGEWKPFENTLEVVASGGMAFKMVEVACGKAHGSFTLTPKNEWDFAAGAVILSEAGGLVVSLRNQAFTYNQENPLVSGMIYGSEKTVETYWQLVQDYLPPEQ